MDTLPKQDGLPGENESWTVYRDYLLTLQQKDNFFERGKGAISWLQGEALNRCVTSKKLKHGQYTKLLAAIKMKKTTAYNCRRIAASFIYEYACRNGYSKMLEKLGWTTIGRKMDLVNDAPEFGGDDIPDSTDTDDLPTTKGQKVDPIKSTEPSNDTKVDPSPKVTYENVDDQLQELFLVARGISRMPQPAIELDHAKKIYHNMRTKAVQVIGLLNKILKNAEKEIRKIEKSAA
jgi:hypothetical protein